MVVRKPTYKKWWLDFQGNIWVNDLRRNMQFSVVACDTFHFSDVFFFLGPADGTCQFLVESAEGQHALTTSSGPFVPLSWKTVEPNEWRGPRFGERCRFKNLKNCLFEFPATHHPWFIMFLLLSEPPLWEEPCLAGVHWQGCPADSREHWSFRTRRNFILWCLLLHAVSCVLQAWKQKTLPLDFTPVQIWDLGWARHATTIPDMFLLARDSLWKMMRLGTPVAKLFYPAFSPLIPDDFC